MRRVLSVSSSRADVGILSPVWAVLDGEPDIELHLLLTGMHMAAASEVTTPAGAIVYRTGTDLGGSGGLDAAAAMASITEATGRVCSEADPDLVLVIGDRLDMIPAVLATLPFNIPIVHLAGGDLSEGAVDDRIRHAITKLSHVHCAINVEAAERIARMGEEPWRVHVTGATGLDALADAPLISAAALATEIGLAEVTGLRLVTVHPETNARDAEAPWTAVVAALESRPGPTLVTAPNSDPGGAVIRARIEEFAAAHPWVSFRDTLGTRLYANAMRHATVMVGNSSSGIVEAALFGLNVINVGRRQEGRMRGANVHDCPNDIAAVAALLDRLTAPATGRPTDSLYGDGKAAPRVARIIRELPDRERLLAKTFSAKTDIRFAAPWLGEIEDTNAAHPNYSAA